MENLPVSDPRNPPAWQVKESSIHGSGLFATRDIAAGELIIEYTGKLSPISEIDQVDGDDIYWLAVDETYAIDGNHRDNPARFANHSCEPNCFLEKSSGAFSIMSNRDISKGEELSIDYGWGLDGLFQRKCRCGTPSCIGYVISSPYRPAALRLINQMRRR